MGDKFQLGPFKDVIVGVRQRVTPVTNFFESFFGSRFQGDPRRYCHLPKLSKGYVNTYDWTQNACARDAGTVTLGDLRSIGQHERDAVMSADVVPILLPGGKGTHVELGIAIAQGRRTILHSQDEVINNVDDYQHVLPPTGVGEVPRKSRRPFSYDRRPRSDRCRCLTRLVSQ